MEKNILDILDLQKLGKELQTARVKRGLKQEDAAKIIQVSRTTITAIEKGERKIRPDELATLANAYGVQINDLIRTRPQIEPFQVQFRGPIAKGVELDENVKEYIQQLEDLSRNYLELENLTNSPIPQIYPEVYNISVFTSTYAAADIISERERIRLHLGDGPISDLREVLEQEVGLRIFYLPFRHTNYSGIYLFDHQLGGCIAVNSDHPEARRRMTLAHDYGHFLTSRYKPVMTIEDYYQRVPESERFADAFASRFLMPATGLAKRFISLQGSKKGFSIANLLTLANYYRVSVEALTLRLEELKLLPTGSWDKLMQKGLKVREAQQELGLSFEVKDSMLPLRYQYLVIIAFDQGLITESQVANYLQTDRLDARRIIEEIRNKINGLSGDIDLDLSQNIG